MTAPNTTVPTAGAEGTPVPAEHSTVGAASKAFLASLTPEQMGRSLKGPDDVEKAQDVATDAADLSFEPPAGDATTATDGAEEAPPVDPITREDGAVWDETAERWKDRAGKFVEGAAPEGWVKGEPAAATDGAPAAEAEAKVITLPGFQERGEQPIEIDVTDPEVAERLQRLAKDGLRRNEYIARSAKLEARQAEIEEFERAIDMDPTGFLLGKIPTEGQLEVARGLILEHFETLRPEIEKWYENGEERERNRVVLRDRMREASDRAHVESQKLAYAREIMGSVHALVPETADDATVRQFMADVEFDLIQAARRGDRVSPETAPRLVEHRLRLYGFNGSQQPTPESSTVAPSAPAVPSNGSATPSAPPARPVSDRARAVAQRAAGPTTEEARAAQDRVRRAQASRRAAAAIPPAGVGAATVQAPVIPADADIRTASKLIRQKAGATW